MHNLVEYDDRSIYDANEVIKRQGGALHQSHCANIMGCVVLVLDSANGATQTRLISRIEIHINAYKHVNTYVFHQPGSGCGKER